MLTMKIPIIMQKKGAISEGVPPYDSNITNHPAT